jgi:hypothetical protein
MAGSRLSQGLKDHLWSQGGFHHKQQGEQGIDRTSRSL